MEIHFKVAGIILIALALLHFIFPKYFNWKEDLKSISLINRQLLKVHTFFIALVVFFIGILCCFYTYELIETKFGKTISLGLAIFWLLRLFAQLFVYSKELWKGKLFETIIHTIFTFFWIYLSFLFWMNYFRL